MSQRSAVPESSRKNRYWAVAALVLVAVAGAYWYFSGSSGAAKKSAGPFGGMAGMARSEEHTSELQSLMRISYAVFCLKKKQHPTPQHHPITHNTYSHTLRRPLVSSHTP